jgi:hypothetical protein
MTPTTRIDISEPSTVYIRFTEEMPHTFIVRMSNGVVEYFRHLDGKTPRMKFNLVQPDTYTTSVPVEILKIVGVEIPKLPELPAPERDRYQGEPEIIYDPNWTVSPASIFTDENLIVHGPLWKEQIPPIRLFIDLHEMGHCWYVTEQYCDLYAFVNFLRMGYNRSTAYYALSKVLKSNPANISRLRNILTNIQNTSGAFSPE